jgi:hypothetical protein
VRSSTFSSSSIFPRTGWSRVWGLALAIVAGTLGLIEAAGRIRGFVPSVRDSAELWSAYRQRCRTGPGGMSPVVTMGSSRFMLGIDPVVLSTTIGRPVIGLAIDASSPIPVLKDLAMDEHFHGIVLCEMGAFIKEGTPQWQQWTERPQQYLRYFASRTAMSDTEALLAADLQSHFVFLLPELSPRTLFADVFSRQLDLHPAYLRMRPDRFRPADYELVDRSRQLNHWIDVFGDLGPPLTAEDLVSFIAEMNGFVSRIQQRGGEVVFFRMVSSDGVRTVEDQHTPRWQWDLFAQKTVGVAIHYEDVPALKSFRAAEGSHLDYRNVDAFSRALGAELIRRGALERDRP